MGPLAPTKASQPPSQPPNGSRLDAVPNVVKEEILKGLKMHEVATSSVLNRGWQKLATNDQVWGTVAQQMKIPLVPKKPAQDVVMDHFFRPINEVVDTFLSEGRTLREMSEIEAFTKAWTACKGKSAKEKYHVLLNCLKTDPSEEQIILKNFLGYYNDGTPLTLASKQLIKNGVLQKPKAKIEVLYLFAIRNDEELFRLVLSKLKETNDYLVLFAEVFTKLCDHGPAATPFLKILCEEGVRPKPADLQLAVDRINESSQHGDQHVKLLLDYSDLFTRNLAMAFVETSGPERRQFIARQSNELQRGQRLEHSLTLELKQKAMIRSAPPPTYGGKGNAKNEANLKSSK